MKTLRQLLATLVLTSVLASVALAEDGIMHGDKTPPPPAPQGIMYPGEPSDEPASDPLTQLAVDLGSSLLRLF